MTINDFQKGSIVFSEYIFILKEKTNTLFEGKF